MPTFPTLNLNGADGESLLGDYCRAIDALRNALEMIGRAAPHGRDYQTMPAGSLEQAMREHRARFFAVEAVRAELETVANDIARQVNERRR